MQKSRFARNCQQASNAIHGSSSSAPACPACSRRSSCTKPGFPNFFTRVGPHSPIGNYSLFTISEIQMDYIMQLIELWRDGRAQAIVPRADATARFNQAIKDSMGGTVWVTGCQSWLLDQNGNPAMWPWSFARFRHDMAAPQLSQFELRAPKMVAATAAQIAA